jgi:hypothetical protein
MSKNEWSYTSTPQYAFMAWRLVKAQGRLYLLPLPYRLKEQKTVGKEERGKWGVQKIRGEKRRWQTPRSIRLEAEWVPEPV